MVNGHLLASISVIWLPSVFESIWVLAELKHNLICEAWFIWFTPFLLLHKKTSGFPFLFIVYELRLIFLFLFWIKRKIFCHVFFGLSHRIWKSWGKSIFCTYCSLSLPSVLKFFVLLFHSCNLIFVVIFRCLLDNKKHIVLVNEETKANSLVVFDGVFHTTGVSSVLLAPFPFPNPPM